MSGLELLNFLEQESSALQLFLGFAGNIFALFFFISPAMKIYSLLMEKIDHTRIAYTQYASTIINCLLWFVYGYRRGVLEILFCNFIGLVLSIVYLISYIYFYVDRNKKKFQQYVLNLLGVIFSLLILFMWVFESFEVAGNLAMIFNIFVYVTPGQKIMEVIKSGDYQLIPIESSIIAFLSSVDWFIYGILDEYNPKIMIPNGLGIIFSSIQLVCWMYYYRLSESNNPNKEKLLEFKNNDDKNQSMIRKSIEKLKKDWTKH